MTFLSVISMLYIPVYRRDQVHISLTSIHRKHPEWRAVAEEVLMVSEKRHVAFKTKKHILYNEYYVQRSQELHRTLTA